MVTLVHRCPHQDCLTERMNFELRATSWGPGAASDLVRNYIHCSCRSCGQPVSIEVADDTGRGRLGPDVGSYPFALEQLGWHIIRVWPASPEPRMPQHMPDQVAKAFLSAERNFLQKGMEEASATSYGRALDVGTKLYAPDLAGETLYNRIKKLAVSHRITSELADWAHEIRLIRNDAVHDDEEITRDELVAIRGFTETVLTYLFTLPGMLKARQAETTQKPGGANG